MRSTLLSQRPATRRQISSRWGRCGARITRRRWRSWASCRWRSSSLSSRSSAPSPSPSSTSRKSMRPRCSTRQRPRRSSTRCTTALRQPPADSSWRPRRPTTARRRPRRRTSQRAWRRRRSCTRRPPLPSRARPSPAPPSRRASSPRHRSGRGSPQSCSSSRTLRGAATSSPDASLPEARARAPLRSTPQDAQAAPLVTKHDEERDSEV
mmetsp:Transcript_22509/g.70593  ORF Transcript_22509/g.70593 Transcript_22509/m.70593 type:complete len:209 (+) Transcript_22509:483-1109(+)